LYTDYDADRGSYTPASGIRIPGPATASGHIPNINDILPPGVTAFDYLFPRRSATPELQYPAEEALRAVTPPPAANRNPLRLHLVDSPEGPALSPLLTLAHVASIVRSASAPIDDPDGILILSPRRQESPSAHTFGAPSRSPSYHVQSPSPRPPSRSSSVEARLGPYSPSPSPPVVPLSPLPPAEEARLDNQENRPPTPLVEVPLDPYAPPPCARIAQAFHPHQFFIIRFEDFDVWRPVSESQLDSLLEYPTHADILSSPPAFPSVFPFKAPSHHLGLVAPTDAFQARLFDVPALTVCANAGHSAPTLDAPLGYIHYTYRASLRDTFLRHPAYVRLCFSGALVVSELHDFLDGRRIYTYGRLRFDNTSVYITDQAYHFEDTVRTYPQLLRFTLTPRIPADPLALVRVFRNEDPL
jgi:hypothetical protein